MEDNEGKGYEVIDKRGKDEEAEDAPAAEQPEAAQAEVGEEQPEAEKEHDHSHEEPISVSVYGLLQWFAAMLTESAWQFMGLQMNPSTKKIEKDMAQARVAVDTVVFLTDQLGPHVTEEQRRAYRAIVSDLRVNFVQQSEKE